MLASSGTSSRDDREAGRGGRLTGTIATDGAEGLGEVPISCCTCTARSATNVPLLVYTRLRYPPFAGTVPEPCDCIPAPHSGSSQTDFARWAPRLHSLHRLPGVMSP